MAPEPHRRIPPARAVLYACGALLLAAAASEVVLRLASAALPIVRYHLSPPWTRNVVPDERLGYRMSPFYPEHDRFGYRNPRGTGRQDVVAIGDSTTYGFSVEPAETWPAILAGLSGRVVYNAGVGGYGPCEYSLVASELIKDRPRSVVLVVYLGNDLINAYESVYLDNRCEQLRSSDAAALRGFERLDAAEPLDRRAAALGEPTAPPAPDSTGFRRLALYSLARSAAYQMGLIRWEESHYHADETYDSTVNRPFRVGLDEPSAFKTVLRDERFYEFVTDLGDPRIEEGLQVLVRAVKRIKAEADASGTELVVGVLGNKPAVLAPILQNQRPDLWLRFAHSIASEQAVVTRLGKALESAGVASWDLSLDVRLGVAAGDMPYQATDDPHHNGAGNRLIAEGIQRHLGTLVAVQGAR